MACTGDLVIVTVNGKSFTGKVKLATDFFISVDQGGGIVALIHHDGNLNSWRMGKLIASVTVTESFGGRLERTYRAALRKFDGARNGF